MSENKGVAKAKKFATEFKAMISKGNVFDMAVGVIIGGAFGKIVTSMVNDILMPCISAITGGVTYADWKILLGAEAYNEAGELITPAIMIGSFISTVVDFLIIALCIFLMIKAIGGVKEKLAKKEEPEEQKEPEKPEEPAPETELDVLKEIRALLSEKKD